MRGARRALSCLLALLLLLSAAACGKEEKATETKETETSFSGGTELTQSDRAFLAQYLADYESGKYDGDKLFAYEDLSSYIILPAYRGISFPMDPMIETTVSDQEVEAYLTQIFLTELPDSEYTAVTEGEICRYDMATLDYRGVMDGQEVADATGTDQTLLIGSATFIPGFEEGLLGKKIGEEIVLSLSFSPYYHADEVAGKDITFFVTVKKVDRPSIPLFTPDVINKYYKTDFTDMAQARDYFREALERMKKNSAHSNLGAYLQKQVLGGCQILSYPEKELAHYENHFLTYYELQKGDLTWEEYCESLGITYETLQTDAKEYAQEEVRILLMVRAIAAKENLVCTSEQLEALIEGIYTTQNVDGYYGNLKSMVTDYTDMYGASYFENMVISAAVAEILVDNAVRDAA